MSSGTCKLTKTQQFSYSFAHLWGYVANDSSDHVDLEFKYIKGKDLLIADALSRSHRTNHTRSQSEEEIETIGLVTQDQNVTSHLKEIAEETAKDNVL